MKEGSIKRRGNEKAISWCIVVTADMLWAVWWGSSWTNLKPEVSSELVGVSCRWLAHQSGSLRNAFYDTSNSNNLRIN